MSYVFDTGIFFDIFDHYYPDRFPSFWEKFNFAIASGDIISTNEVFREIEKKEDSVFSWAKTHKDIFTEPIAFEMDFVTRIFSERPHFQQMIEEKKRLKGQPVADPFIIAKAYIEERCVVTTEKWKKNSAKIPNVCEYFGIPCVDFEGFMKEVNWKF